MKIFREFFRLILINVLFFQFSIGISYANSLQPAQPTLENFILDNLINDTVLTIKTMVEKNEFPELNEKTTKYKNLILKAKELIAKNPDFLKNLKVERKGNTLIMSFGSEFWIIDYKGFLKTGVFSLNDKKLEFEKIHELKYLDKMIGIEKTSSFFYNLNQLLISEAHATIDKVLLATGIMAWSVATFYNLNQSKNILKYLRRKIALCKSDLESLKISSGKGSYLPTHSILDFYNKFEIFQKTLRGEYGGSHFGFELPLSNSEDISFWKKITLGTFDNVRIQKVAKENLECLQEFAKLDQQKGREFTDSRAYEKLIGPDNAYYQIIKSKQKALKN